MTSPDRHPPLPESELPAAVDALARGDPDAAERISRTLAEPLRRAAAAFLGAGSPEVDDIVQDSLLAVLGYVEQAGGFVTDTAMKPLRYNTKDSLLNPFFLVFGDNSRDWSVYL